jgi:hypothetical protein
MLQKFRSEVEKLCIEQEINLVTKIKRSNCSTYIKELIAKMKPKRLNNNYDYTKNAMFTTTTNNNSVVNSTFIKQTLLFEEKMTNLSYKKCNICHQRRLKLIVNDGFSLVVDNKKD